MTEILTESFCERCGTRYTFESAAPRRSRVGRVRVLSKGVRNFVMSDGSTLAEAMADARSEHEVRATSHQLDAFHKTFNFCLNCRQYTCGNCWNDGEGRCMTCAPLPEAEVIDSVALVAASEPLAIPEEDPALAGNGQDEVPQAWPAVDLANRVEHQPKARSAAAGALLADAALTTLPEAELDLDLEPEFEPGAAAEVDTALEADTAIDAVTAEAALDVAPIVATDVAAVEEIDAAVEDEPAAAAAIGGMVPGLSLQEAVAEYEARLAAHEAAEATARVDEPQAISVDVEPELAAVAEPVVEPELAAVAEPVVEPELAAVVEPEPAAVVEPELAAVVEPELAAVAEPELAAAAEPELTAVVEPELAAAAEPELTAVVEPTPESETIAPALAASAALAAAPEPDAELELEIAAELAAGPEPEVDPDVAAAPTPEPAAPARADVIEQPVWPVPSAPADAGIAAAAAPPPAPPSPAAPANPWLTVAPDDGTQAEPQWPQAPIWARSGSGTDAPVTLAGRSLLPQGNASAMWAASAREVLSGGPQPTQPEATAAPTAQPCINCGLPLSANAKFCRRCGSRQG